MIYKLVAQWNLLVVYCTKYNYSKSIPTHLRLYQYDYYVIRVYPLTINSMNPIQRWRTLTSSRFN